MDPFDTLWVDDKSEKEIPLKNTSLKKKFRAAKEKLLNLSQEVYCEGLPKIFENGSNIVNRLVFVFLFLFFSALTCFLMTQNVSDFFR